LADAAVTTAKLGSLTVNDQVASYTLVVGDVNKRVIMNSSSSTTITVNNSIFSAGNVVEIVNKGTANTVITAGAGVSITSSGSLTVPANGSGRLLALSASAFIYGAGGITASSGALTLITAGTFTTATSVSLPTDTFSATYRNYRVIWEMTAQTTSVALTMRLRSSGSDVTTAAYYQGSPGFNNNNSASSQADSASSSFTLGTTLAGSVYGQAVLVLDVISPQIASISKWINGTWSAFITQTTGRSFSGTFSLSSGTQTYDSLSFISSVASSITGVYRVYGYADS
jgi:hypothetical protein